MTSLRQPHNKILNYYPLPPSDCSDEGDSDWERRLVQWHFLSKLYTDNLKKQNEASNPRTSLSKQVSTSSEESDSSTTNDPKSTVSPAPASQYTVATINLILDKEDRFQKLNECQSIITEPILNASGRFECTECKKSFGSKYLARLHVDAVHKGLLPYVCHVCKKAFPNPRRRFRHIKVVHTAYLVQETCSVPGCAQRFSNPISKAEHMHSCHRKITKTFQCDICNNATFPNDAVLQKHLLVLHTPRALDGSFPCIFRGCKVHSKTYKALRQHILVHKDPTRQYTCDRPGCSETFVTYSDLIEHRRTAHVQNELRCPTCSRVFQTVQRFKNHLEAAHGLGDQKQIEFICPLRTCRKTVTSIRNLREHVLYTHLQLRQYVCQTCQAVFTTRNAAYFHTKKFHKTASPQNNVKVRFSIDGIDTDAKVNKIFDLLQTKHPVMGVLLMPNGALDINNIEAFNKLQELLNVA